MPRFLSQRVGPFEARVLFSRPAVAAAADGSLLLESDIDSTSGLLLESDTDTTSFLLLESA